MLPFQACNPVGDFWSACSYVLSGARQVKSLEIQGGGGDHGGQDPATTGHRDPADPQGHFLFVGRVGKRPRLIRGLAILFSM